jgi:branched-subunit amino acid aminotransferase/4-amino-4-deoxychorismate lyase
MAEEFQVWLNDELVPYSEAKIGISDPGFQYGDAAFDATRTYNHRPFRLDVYLDRFFASLQALDIDPRVTREQLTDIIDRVLAENLKLVDEHTELQIVMRCTRGSDYKNVLDTGRPTLIVETPTFLIDAPAYHQGVELVTASIRRFGHEVAPPQAKTHFRLNNVLAELEVRRRSPNAKALMLDPVGNVCEGSSWNIAALVRGRIVSPKNNCLPGRGMLTAMECAAKLGIPAAYDDLTLFDVYTSPEVFITGSSFGMMPVRTVDGRTIGTQWPGPIQERLWVEYNEIAGLDVREQATKHLNARAPGADANLGGVSIEAGPDGSTIRESARVR